MTKPAKKSSEMSLISHSCLMGATVGLLGDTISRKDSWEYSIIDKFIGP